MQKTSAGDGMQERRRVIIVTGMSGAGKSSALAAFEDLGFQTVDNLPLSMVAEMLKVSESEAHIPVAIGVDSRTLRFSPEHFTEVIDEIRARRDEIDLQVLMLDAVDGTLVQRYSETRRRHPLEAGQPLRDAIKKERALMAGIRQSVNALVDTSTRSAAETRRVIVKRYGLDAGPRLVVSIMSFGYSFGVPRDADLVMDVRFLRNPHYDPELKSLTGQNERVSNYVRADESFTPFVERLQSLLALLLPRYRAEGKSYLTLAFGCTGGKHRSVMMAETFASILEGAEQKVSVYHRDMPGARVDADHDRDLRDTAL